MAIRTNHKLQLITVFKKINYWDQWHLAIWNGILSKTERNAPDIYKWWLLLYICLSVGLRFRLFHSLSLRKIYFQLTTEWRHISFFFLITFSAQWTMHDVSSLLPSLMEIRGKVIQANCLLQIVIKLLSCLLTEREKILMKYSKYFSIIVDSAPDFSRTDQLAFV